MRKEDIQKLLDVLDVPKIGHVRNHFIFPCVLAPWTHKRGTDSHPSMEIKINPEGESLYFCFACKRGGTLTNLLMELNTYTRGKYEKLASWATPIEMSLGVSTIRQQLLEDYTEKEHEDEKKIFDPALFDRFAGGVPQYILDRGITLDTCKAWSLGYDEQAGRVVFPVYDWFGNLVGLAGRAVREDILPKYDNYWYFNKSHYLYGEHLLQQECPHVIVTEGQISALAAYQAGLGNVVALMGSSLGKEQKKKLMTLGRVIYLMADMDEAGELCRKQFAKELHNYELRIATLPEEDPAKCTQDQLQQALKTAKIVRI